MLTTLKIINEMVASTGTAPLTASDTSHPFYVKANNKLETVNREVQSQGWWFNKARRKLLQNIDGEVVIPTNTLHCDPVDRNLKYVIRGTRLYDLNNATFMLDRDVEVWFVDLVEIADLPPSAGEYIRAKAVYDFYLNEDGNALKVGEYKSAMLSAWVSFKGEHLKNADVNWFDGTSIAQQRRGTRGRRLPFQDE
jgi:hypothetical protein